MQRVVVTGADSMIGTALIRECVKNNVEALAIVRKNCTKLGRLPKSEQVRVALCNLEELDAMAGIAKMGNDEKAYDVFYHFAWAHTQKESRDNPVLQEENIRYTLSAVKLAHRLGCKKFIGAGSQAEYGRVEHVITPDTPVHPQTCYGTAKYAAGNLSRKLCIQYGIVHLWARIFSVYGIYDNEETMLSYAIKQFFKGEPAEFSSAVQMWDYLYEDDAGKIFYLLGQRAEENKVYCVANGNYRPLKEYIKELQQAYGEGAICRFASGHNQMSAGLQPDVSSLRRDIEYQPQTAFREGIMKIIQHRKKMYDTMKE